MAIQPDVILNKEQAIKELRSRSFHRSMITGEDGYRFVNQLIPTVIADELITECVAECVDDNEQYETLRYRRIDNDKLINDAVGLAQTFKEMAYKQGEEMFEGDADLIMQLVGKIRQLSSLVIEQNSKIESARSVYTYIGKVDNNG